MPERPDPAFLSKLFECPFTWSNRIARPIFALLTEDLRYVQENLQILILGEIAVVAEKKKTLVFLATAVKLRGNLNATNIFLYIFYNIFIYIYNYISVYAYVCIYTYLNICRYTYMHTDLSRIVVANIDAK